MTPHRRLITSAAASAIALSFVSDAFADVSAEAVLESVQRQFAVQGVEINVDSAELRGGDDVLLSGVSFAGPGDDKGVKLDQVLLEDVAEGPNGAFIIGRVAAPAFTTEQDGFTFAFEGGSIEGYYLAGPDETDPVLKGGVYRAIQVGGFAVSKGSNTVFTLEGAQASMSPYEPGGTMDYDMEIKDFTVDFTQVDDPKTSAAMAELGYSKLTGRMTGDGSWNAASGDLSMDNAVVIDEAATLNIGLAIGGYTMELMDGLQKLNVEMQNQSDEAMGLAMLGLAQQVQIGNVTIEIVDDSATGRILDFVAKQQGTNRESIIAQAKGALPFALGQLQNPEFAASVAAAVSAFLEDPGSLKVAAAPANPVPVAQIVGAVMTAPQSLIGVLGVTVTANE
ncbi:hypothetical protein [Oricola sp.]|uniref:hypothetical protein n=1 Tax=Oricola sp. TaxID=1979950 RepID=UPI0025D1C5B3|nr:hypothetical protein [Oricola sp.]MCI5077160.1 YdgA family protein [Oricola sp.]